MTKMKPTLFAFIASLLIVGCTTGTLSQYPSWTEEPTPSIWKLDGVWGLVLLDQEGSILRTMTVRFTNREAESCSAGDWMALEVLAERPEKPAEAINNPAYFVSGGALMIDLNANLCDNYYPMLGHLTDLGVSGTHGWETMFGGETVGSYHGFPIEN